MVSGTILVTGAIIALASQVSAHASFFSPSMWGFNKTDTNRPQDPLMNCTFDEWWFHGHLDYPPHPEDIEQLPVGGSHNFQISCDKDATTYWTSGPGGDQQDPSNPDWPCPGQPSVRFHANNISDTAGCALAVAYKSDVSEVQPDDFIVFSVNHTCVWYLNTYFEIPADMPACPDGKCICAWFWIHYPDSGSEQMYMTGFQCNFTGATSTTPLPPGQLPRRCGYDPIWDTPADPSNCTYGPKLPMYWYQFEGNNMHEDPYHAPTYGDVYGFPDGAQNDIFWVNGTKPNDTSSAIPSDNTTSPVPSDDPPASSTAPPPSSSSSSYPSASSPSPSPSSPAADNVDLSDPASSSSPSPLPSSSSPDPAQSLPSSASSPPAGNVDPSNTLPTDSDSYPPQSSSQLSPYPSSSPNPTVTTDPESTSLPSSDSYPLQSQSSSQPSPYPSSSPNPTLTTDPESESQPPSSNPPQKSNGKCRPKSTSSSAYLSTPSPSPSPSQDNVRRANKPVHRRASSLEDKRAARRVWGHRSGNA